MEAGRPVPRIRHTESSVHTRCAGAGPYRRIHRGRAFLELKALIRSRTLRGRGVTCAQHLVNDSGNTQKQWGKP